MHHHHLLRSFNHLMFKKKLRQGRERAGLGFFLSFCQLGVQVQRFILRMKSTKSTTIESLSALIFAGCITHARRSKLRTWSLLPMLLSFFLSLHYFSA